MLALHQVFKWLHYESDYQKWAAPLLGVLHNKTEEWAEKEFFYGLNDAIRIPEIPESHTRLLMRTASALLELEPAFKVF